MNRNLLFVAAICSPRLPLRRLPVKSRSAAVDELYGSGDRHSCPLVLRLLRSQRFTAWRPGAGDPGGITQSFGSFAQARAPDPDLDPKSTFAMPGFGCNPNRA
jgi:hypothetical protein